MHYPPYAHLWILICSLAFCARLQQSRSVGNKFSVFSFVLVAVVAFFIHISIFNWCRGMEHILVSSFVRKLYAETETLVTLWLFRALLSVAMLPGKKQVASLHADFLVFDYCVYSCTGCVFLVYTELFPFVVVLACIWADSVCMYVCCWRSFHFHAYNGVIVLESRLKAQTFCYVMRLYVMWRNFGAQAPIICFAISNFRFVHSQHSVRCHRIISVDTFLQILLLTWF